MTNVYGYMRISTKEKDDKQKFTRQEQALNRYAKENHFEYVLVFRDDVSGKSFENRHEWKKLERIVQPDDIIIFKSIDRFTRNVDEGLDQFSKLMKKGIHLVFIDNPTLSTDYMKNLLAIAETQENRITKELMTFVTRILLIAELDRAQKERELISTRTKDGMTARQAEAAARGEHWRAGRKPGQLDKMTPELEADLREYLADRSIKGVTLMKKYHISRTTLLKYAEIIKTQKMK